MFNIESCCVSYRTALLQDSDGFHIAGLFLSFLHHYWPALVARGYLYRFVTPLVKCTHKRSKKVSTFYDIHAYESWASTNDTDRHHIKYYKGLGTSTRAESIAMFSNLGTHLKRCVSDDETAPMLTKVFDPKKASERKEWLLEDDSEDRMDYESTSMNMTQFLKTEVKTYSLDSVDRAIPSMCDFLKGTFIWCHSRICTIV